MKLPPSRWLCALILCLLAVRAPAATLTTLYSFPESPNGLSQPTALVQGGDGSLYGANAFGGPHGTGTVFKLTTGGEFTMLHAFSGRDADVGGVNNDGASPFGPLALDTDGNLYGTARDAGRYDEGTVFRLTPAGAFTTLHAFNEYSNGSAPVAGLLAGRDGNFYGTATTGGQDGNGTVFRLAPDGTLTTVFSFGNAEASNARARLVQDADGNFYGTTRGGGLNYNGTIFKLAADGTFKRLHSFGGTSDGLTNADGFHPESALVFGTDGNLYGTTPAGGKYGYGTVFRITPAGVFHPMHNFNPVNGDGASPASGLLLGGDGYFYGTTEFGGANDTGAIFRINAAGAEAVLYSFGALDNDDANADGAFPLAGLFESADGNFYGTTYDGGVNGYGTVFAYRTVPKITSAATASVTVGQAFSYQITATNDPTRFGVAGLPAGFHVDPKTGLVTGTPSKVGKIKLTLIAYNAFGKRTAPLVISVKVTPPTITSSLAITVKSRTAIQYQITATGNPTQYTVQRLDGSSSVSTNPTTGAVVLSCNHSGNFRFVLNAFNGGGKGSATLVVTAH